MDLQALINSQIAHGKLELPAPGEFFGQITIDRPLTIIGRGKSTWIGSRLSPTIRITAQGVRLQKLTVENTVGPHEIALEADPGTNPILEGVLVKGMVVGVPSEHIRPKVGEDDSSLTKISFLPPPPMSAPDEGDHAGRASTEKTVPASTNPEAESIAKSGARATTQTHQRLHQRVQGISQSRSIWQICTTILAVLTVILAIQYVEQRGKTSLTQTEDLEVLLKKADADKDRFSQEIDRLRVTLSQRKKDNDTQRDTIRKMQQEIEKASRLVIEKDKKLAEWQKYASEMEKYATDWETIAAWRQQETDRAGKDKSRVEPQKASTGGWHRPSPAKTSLDPSTTPWRSPDWPFKKPGPSLLE